MLALASLGVIALAIGGESARAAFPGDEGRIAFAGTSEGEDYAATDIFTILPDGSSLARLTDTDDAFEASPSWSADGRKLVFTRGSEVWVMGSDGADPRLIADSGKRYSSPSPAFSPSGNRIVYSTVKELRTVPVNGGDSDLLMRTPQFVVGPRYSPDGKRIVFAGSPNRFSGVGIWSVRRDGSDLRQLTRDPADRTPDYSPDGRHIVFMRTGDDRGQDTLFVMRADGSRERAISPPGELLYPAFSPTGRRIVARGTESLNTQFPNCSDLYTITRRGADKRRVTDNCPQTSLNEIGATVDAPSWQPLPNAAS